MRFYTKTISSPRLDRKGRTYCDEEEGEEGGIVSTSNTVIYPGTVVVTAFYTIVALEKEGQRGMIGQTPERTNLQ